MFSEPVSISFIALSDGKNCRVGAVTRKFLLVQLDLGCREFHDQNYKKVGSKLRQT